jgi:hypothetical protein
MGHPTTWVLHVRMLDNDNHLQQQAIGILGVNLIYACYRYNHDPELMLQSLMDSLRGRVKIDMVRLTGPDFESLDNRLLSLWIVKNRLSDVAIFGADRQNMHASEFLYKKHVMLVRGSFRPATLVNLDMLKASFQQFRTEPDIDPRQAYLLTEITLDNLRAEGELDEQDFLDRAELLNTLGYTVVVSDCQEYQKMTAYLSDYRVQRIGIVLGVRELLDLINDKYYKTWTAACWRLLASCLPIRLKFYIYPALQGRQRRADRRSECAHTRRGEIPLQTFAGQPPDRRCARLRPRGAAHFFQRSPSPVAKRRAGLGSLGARAGGQPHQGALPLGYPAEQLEFDY